MFRANVGLCVLVLVALVGAVPLAVVERFVPIAVDPNGVHFHPFQETLRNDVRWELLR
ncbi:hypothetical protein ANCCAN_06497 [Ancylostoma caninum]|uniref:Uncharacterized protein n=1 Tax=Ancylostoma caninum TaxID=29170 RepID=A0A368GSV2_ANCCA|nr:hypothetical protein ANCCAN_06497 [Ancylostoma caninum]